jgi:type I restriction enzyme, S subunit
MTYYTLNDLIKISKEKYNPKKEKNSYKCIELENIERESGKISGFVNSNQLKSTKNKFSAKDVLFGKLRPYLRKYAHPGFDGVCSSEIWVFQANKRIINERYLFYLVQTDKFIRFSNLSTGSKMPRADWTLLKDVEFKIPRLEEQKKIANILSTWDRAIELKEEILDNYKKQKTYYQQIIYSERSLRNRIQVKNVKLRKFIRESKNNNKKLLISNVLSVTNSQGFVLQTDHFSKSVASKITSNYKIVKKNEFAYNPSRINVGSIDMLTGYDEGLLSPMYVVFNTTEGLEPRYLFHYLKSSRFVRRIPSYVQGSVRDSLTYSALQAMPIPLPEIEYQKKISVFFDKLDHLIQTLSVEIKVIKEQKLGLMQQLLTGKIRVQT